MRDASNVGCIYIPLLFLYATLLTRFSVDKYISWCTCYVSTCWLKVQCSSDKTNGGLLIYGKLNFNCYHSQLPFMYDAAWYHAKLKKKSYGLVLYIPSFCVRGLKFIVYTRPTAVAVTRRPHLEYIVSSPHPPCFPGVRASVNMTA